LQFTIVHFPISLFKIVLQFTFWIILVYMEPTYTFYFIFWLTLLKNSKNIRLWHSLCYKDFLFWREVYNIKLYNYYSFKKCNALYVYFIYSFQVSFKAIWSVKMNVKSLKNILIVNHNFVVTIGLPYCYLPFVTPLGNRQIDWIFTIGSYMFVFVNLNVGKLETWKLSSMPTLFLLNFIKIIKLFWL
jgi:hypothetical protein